MWSRADLKQDAKSVLRKNYWKPFAVSLVCGLLSGSGGSGGGSSNAGQRVREMMDSIDQGTALLILGVILAVTVLIVVIALAFQFFVSGPIGVGKCRFYLENREGDPGFSRMFYGFSHCYMNNAAAMFVTNLFIGLWSLLFIVPGIIKQLAWSQVPYLLAENPSLTGARAREISRRMTDGEKLEIFVLGLSFLGWILLGMLACGVGVFFVQPYMDAAYTELYARLREKALSTGIATPDELPGLARNA